jgi:hypothetical protein
LREEMDEEALIEEMDEDILREEMDGVDRYAREQR